MFLQEGSEISSNFTLTLFGELNEVHNSSVGPAVRHKCLNGILRMLYYSPSELLDKLIEKFPVSSQMAGMLASNDLRTVVNAMQMADILMQKQPDYFHIHFRREGVMHKIYELATASLEPRSEDFKNVCSREDTSICVVNEEFNEVEPTDARYVPMIYYFCNNICTWYARHGHGGHDNRGNGMLGMGLVDMRKGEMVY